MASPSGNPSPPRPRCSKVSGSALGCGPLPATRPAPLWMCRHGNLGHLTHRLAQHGDWIPWAPPAPRSLGRSGFLGWASQPAGARGTRGDPGPEPPRGASHSLGVTWCFGVCDPQASRDFRRRGSTSHAGWPGRCPQMDGLSLRVSPRRGQPAPGEGLRQNTAGALSLLLPPIPPSTHQAAIPARSACGRRSRARPPASKSAPARGSGCPASSKF